MKVENNVINYKLPDDFNSESVEIIIFPAKESSKKGNGRGAAELRKRWKVFCKSLPEREPDISDDEIVSLVKEARAESHAKRKKQH